MKANYLLLRKTMILAFAIATSLTILSSCHKNYQTGNVDTGVYTINGNASASQMVPSVNASGTGTISGTYNTSNHVITWTANWSGLTGTPTSASFYAGAAGSTGTAAGTPWTLGTNLTSTGSVSGTMVLTSDQASQLLNGGWYYTMGTVANAKGEIRGQISTKVY